MTSINKTKQPQANINLQQFYLKQFWIKNGTVLWLEVKGVGNRKLARGKRKECGGGQPLDPKGKQGNRDFGDGFETVVPWPGLLNGLRNGRTSYGWRFEARDGGARRSWMVLGRLGRWLVVVHGGCGTGQHRSRLEGATRRWAALG